MLSELTNKRALVTGAAQGLGRAVAELFVERGARVVLADIDMERLHRTATELGGTTVPVRCDVTDADQVAAAVAKVESEWGGLDIAVNNAGIEVASPLVDQAETDFDRLMAINVKGVFLGIKYAAPALAKAGGGAVINMASVAGLGGVPLLGSYCASKAAVIRLSETAALELRDSGVRVNAVCPSFVDTEMVNRLVDPFEAATGAKFEDVVAVKQQRLGTPEEVAEIVAFLASDDARFITASHYVLDCALSGSLF
ncbi:NAD(P)-dependent dehydrogenase, short-chain alcohol dehydrogenase family [Haloechinothrix alba]|uniref:NAD(P)-dependent dehydrogenase, short-chain alcohol dehydrogenase family n=1 Tax=Haloechinothrix alba TaxID=664784 RepID=A0A238ZLA7_9PSEU|nr:SDR family oxidoreductase [Haloechinothrix alba]SNR83972.1 NAD(P)-dependent dehydrogenase, short-chain alcohol dehydrogenase family [Haloechinothrix alba]